MDKYKKRYNRINGKIIQNKNNLKNRTIKRKKINSSETIQIKNILNNSKENDKRVIYHSGKNKIKMNHNKIAFQDENKIYINNCKIKFREFHILINMIVSFMNFYVLSCEYNNKNILSKLSEVTLKVNETGSIKLFSDDFFRNYNNCEIYLNDTFINRKINKYYIDSNTNCSENICLIFIKIIWNDTILTTKKMFENCSKI